MELTVGSVGKSAQGRRKVSHSECSALLVMSTDNEESAFINDEIDLRLSDEEQQRRVVAAAARDRAGGQCDNITEYIVMWEIWTKYVEASRKFDKDTREN